MKHMTVKKNKEYYKLKMQHLIALRSNLIAALIVLVGGVVGLFLSEVELPKLIVLIILGLYYAMIFISNLININNDIKEVLKETEDVD